MAAAQWNASAGKSFAINVEVRVALTADVLTQEEAKRVSLQVCSGDWYNRIFLSNH